MNSERLVIFFSTSHVRVASAVPILNHAMPRFFPASLRAKQSLQSGSPGNFTASAIHCKWQKIYPGRAQQIALPRYPWQHEEEHWLDFLSSKPASATASSAIYRASQPAGSNIRALLAQITRIAQSKIHADTALRELGIDSLITLELQTQLKRMTGTLLPVETLVQAKTVGELEQMFDNSVADPAPQLQTQSTTPNADLQRSPEIREASFDDYEQITSLISRNGLGTRTRDRWEHLWSNNPVYKKLTNWPIGWVVEQNSEIVGYLGNIPLTYHLNGCEIFASGLHAFSLDESHRGHGACFAEPLVAIRSAG